ncbi:type II toxin-antitoxin system Phd/YefM family antitoxin [Candidatus Acetothermia bacterium]|nr:type II toxin-antitoxin system Phd/YefM family antitoxin [Candidatus Acetothermia bacterium]
MTKKVTAIKARQNLGELLEEVYYRNDHFIVTRRQKAMAVIIPVDDYERLMKQRNEAFSVIDEIRARNKVKDPKVIEADVARVVAQVRAEKKSRHAKSRH